MNPSSPTPAASPAATPSPVLSARTLVKSLQEEFPAFRDSLPLAIGIDKQLLARRPDLDRKILRIALGMHTNSLRYIKVMAKATTRFDLDGNAGDALTDEHRKHAVETLRERSKKEAERRKVQREAETAQRQAESAQREAEAAERQRAQKLSQLVAKFGRDG